MYEEYPEIYKINKSIGKPIWRYMDFWKFLNLLETSSLYFSNAENLGDNYEGRIPKVVFDMMLKKDAKYYSWINKNVENHVRKETLISSWSYNEKESFALWKMYAKDKMGIALKTDFKSLIKSFDKTERIINIGEIIYFNSENFDYSFIDINYVLQNKLEYYCFENEIRCVTICKPDEEIGNKLVEVDLNELIQTIYISPIAKPEHKKLIELLRKEYNLNFNIEFSEVNDSWL